MELFHKVWTWIWNDTILYIKLPVIIGAIVAIYKLVVFVIGIFRNYRDNKSLMSYYNDGVTIKARKNFIRTKCQNIDPSDEINLKSSFAFVAKEDLLKFFLKKVFKGKNSKNQFYLILGDSGMGKTTFMLNLFSRYNSIIRFVLTREKIVLLPLGIDKETLKQEIQKIEAPINTIILLDGFDEAPYVLHEDIASEFDNLIDMVKSFKTVLITCRTHYFSSEKEEPNELKVKKFNTEGNGFHSVKKMYVSPFEDKDVSKYINRTFGLLNFKQNKIARKILKKTDDLLFRPMLLSYIHELVKENKQEYQYRIDIYEVLVVAWLNRESNKYPVDQKFIFESNLAFFTYEICKYIHKNYSVNGLYVPLEEIDRLSQEFQIDLNKIELKSRSLLNRDSNGYYKFSHKSIFEFVLAYLAYENRFLKGEYVRIHYNLKDFDQSILYFEEMVYSSRVDFKLPEVYVRFEGANKEHIKLVLQEKSKSDNKSKKKINWIDEYTYELK
ncbi:MAG: hypothetical protein K9I26_05110 [Flavobacterium sp.]|jgi:hypothetical protein|nr:hypothetical protein [Flavobacterium sp.]